MFNKFILDSVRLGLSSSENILQKAGVAPLRVVFLLRAAFLTLNTKFFQIWSSVSGYGELCVCFQPIRVGEIF